jgi:hypothetical protein
MLPAAAGALTLGELQRLYETILGLQDGERLDRANFRRHLLREGKGTRGKLASGIVEPVPGQTKPARRQPAQVYRFVPDAFWEYVAARRQRPF